MTQWAHMYTTQYTTWLKNKYSLANYTIQTIPNTDQSDTVKLSKLTAFCLNENGLNREVTWKKFCCKEQRVKFPL